MRILIEIHEGHIVRNLLENGLLDQLTNQGAEVIVATPGASVPAFAERYEAPGVHWRTGSLEKPLSRRENYELAIGNWLCTKRWPRLRRAMWRCWGERIAARRAVDEKRLLDETRPDVVVSTHLSQVYGRYLIAAARRRGIPTVGNLNSWDNVWKGLRVRPDLVSCWSNNNRDEICRLAGYRPESVRVIGAPAFDGYLSPDACWSKAETCSRLGLDSSRPILLFATLGQFQQNIDETSPLEVLLRSIDKDLVPNDSQVVLRLHPWSRETYFSRLLAHPAVTVSRYENYVPGLTWTPTRAETALAGNLLRHADVVITPGSTMAIEPAIFNTPTLITALNEYMPERFAAYFRETWLNRHFRRIVENDWLPVAHSEKDMIRAINHALADRRWQCEGRARIREELLGPLDGCATERFSRVILEAGGQRVRSMSRNGTSAHTVAHA